MPIAKPEGERDATIIPFPLHRVTEVPSAPVREMAAIVHELDTMDNASEEHVPAEAPAKVVKRARNVSLHALSGKSHSVAEMRDKLRARELPEDVVEAEMAELARTGLLDDDALARDLVDRYAGRERLARRAVEAKLRHRKIPAGIIDRALDDLESDSEKELAVEAARDRLRKMGSLAPDVAKRRLFSYLQRKGFQSSDIVEAISAVLR